MIKIKISADTAEELRQSLIVLIGENRGAEVRDNRIETPGGHYIPINQEIKEPEPAPVEQPKTRARAPKEKAAEPIMRVLDAGDPLAPVTTGTPLPEVTPEVKTGDPLAQLPVATSSDPLAGGSQTNGVAEPGVLTLEMIRHKVAKAALNNNKQAVKDLIKTYVTAEGKPCEITTEIPEKDWADYYAKLDLIGL